MEIAEGEDLVTIMADDIPGVLAYLDLAKSGESLSLRRD